MKKKIIKNTIQSCSTIPFCIGKMDGILIPLTIIPSIRGKYYFTCNMNYALLTLVIIDHEGKFLYINASYAGSTHDS